MICIPQRETESGGETQVRAASQRGEKDGALVRWGQDEYYSAQGGNGGSPYPRSIGLETEAQSREGT